MNNGNRISTRGLVLGALPAAALAAAGVAFAATTPGPQADASIALASDTTLPAEVERAIDRASGLSSAFSYAADRIAPSVVHLSVERTFRTTGGSACRSGGFDHSPLRPMPDLPPGLIDRMPELEQFFGRRGPTPRAFSRESIGSGVIVSKAGHIVTNHHVLSVGGPAFAPSVTRIDPRTGELSVDIDTEVYDIANRQLSVTVTLHDGTERSAKLVASDPETDLAVLKLDLHEGDELTPAVFADSDELGVGEWIVAAGSPFGLGGTITAGIVSTTARSGVGLSPIESYIQTDAAINPGNSGGPLVNLRGEVVGINTAIASRSGGFNGVGFAIPANLVRATYDNLLDDGVANRPLLGVTGQDLTEDLAESFGMPRDVRGALVTSVSEGSAASAAGLDRGDVITAIDGKPVRSFNGLRVRLAEYSPGDEVELTVNRSGEERVLYATLGAFEAASASSGGGPDDAPTLLRRDAFGATIEDVPGAGVRITAVEPGSLAQRMGIAPGSVIVEINGVQVESASDYAAASSRINPAEGVRVFVRSPSGVGRYLFMRTR